MVNVSFSEDALKEAIIDLADMLGMSESYTYRLSEGTHYIDLIKEIAYILWLSQSEITENYYASHKIILDYAKTFYRDSYVIFADANLLLTAKQEDTPSTTPPFRAGFYAHFR